METLNDMSDADKKYLTLPHAEGSIDAKEHQQERLEEFTERVGTGEFHRPVKDEVNIPVICVDGRPNGFNLLPNAAGGTETILVADDLTFQRFKAEDGSTAGAFKNLITYFEENGLPTGGHTDDHHPEGASGCGANDRLALIYDFIRRKPEVLRDLATKLGLNDQQHDLIVSRAHERVEFSGGDEMLATLRANKSTVVEELQGAHNEVVAVINLRKGTTLDRAALQEEFGNDYQAFNVDAWAFEEAARVNLGDDADQEAIDAEILAMAYYNLATTHVLAGPNLRVVILR